MKSALQSLSVLAVIVAAIPGAVFAGIPVIKGKPTAIEQFTTIQKSLRQAHAAKDATAYLHDSLTLHDLLNGSPNSILQLMLAQFFAGESAKGIGSFEQFVRMGQSNEEVLESKQFDALRTLPQYPALHAEMVANNVSKSVATKAFELTDPELLPEDIDYDRTTELFYITSILKKEILVVDKTGNAHVFATAPDKWPMMAVKVDSHRHLLWATEVAMDGFSWISSADWGRSFVLLYDLKTNKLLWRIEVSAHAALGDMTLTAEGDAVVSDGEHGGVYRVSRRTQQIERLDAGDFISPQTIAMIPGGKLALVPDYVRGIGILNMKTRYVSWIPMQGRYALSGIDGLYLSGRTLIATQNGTSPERVVRFDLDSSLSYIGSETIIERGTSTLGDPTHGVILNGHFYYIANSGWDRMDEHGNLKAGTTPSATLVMRVDLNKR